MADEFDDLFGAFDGDESETTPEEQLTQDKKKARNDDYDHVAKKTTKKDATKSAEPVPKIRTTLTEYETNIPTPMIAPTIKSKAKAKPHNEEVSTGTAEDKSVRSYSSLPPDYKPAILDRTKPPAKTYAYTLDPFQVMATEAVEKGESVLVAAHTSAGKTTVAEYAVAKSLRDGQRVIYTSPIKALSNQKYRDLAQEFGDDNVGLMTGDITINPDAAALVMTTEILRSMLYRGSEVMREVAWVIYDEVHYMRDKERGVVWEESIILLPHSVRYVFLSATIPNAEQFADWICKIHRQPCHVVYTNYRPVPLQHYIFPAGGQGLHLVVDEKGKFREANFQRAMSSLQSGTDGAIADAMLNSGNGKGNSRRGGAKKRKNAADGQNSDLHRIVKLVMERGLNPVIIFSFSKKDCERYALDLHKEDFNPDETEKDLVSQVYTNAIEALSEDDKQLPQVEALLPLLKRGIGIHHGGLLPILKEIVEILFSEGLIKCLFATETFAIGINMPAKTVVFTNCRKWDGVDFRWVTSGEYIQMSGRAGRRGKDDRGIVIQMLDEKMEPDICKGILYGDPDPLNSSYRISYNMLLNMMRVEDVDPEHLIRASFHQFQQESEAPAIEAEGQRLEDEATLISVEDESLTKEYFQLESQLVNTNARMSRMIRKPEHILGFLAPGRLLEIEKDGERFGWGALIAPAKKKTGTGTGGMAGKQAEQSAAPLYSVEILLKCVVRTSNGKDENAENIQEMVQTSWRGSMQTCRAFVDGKDEEPKAEMRVFSCGLEHIQNISQARIFLPSDISGSKDKRQGVMKTLSEVRRRFPDELPLLDPVKDMGVNRADYSTLKDRAVELARRIADHQVSKTSDYERSTRVQAYAKKAMLLEQSRILKREARSAQTMVMRDELKRMKKALRQLDHVDATGVIQTKGRTACEINTADELVVVELVFSGIFNDLNVEQSVALLSCMIFDEKVKDNDDTVKDLKSYLRNPYFKLQEAARSIAKALIACKIEMEEDEFVEKFNPGMMEAVYAWCKGVKFIEVQKLTGTFEGTTIRTLRRLEELVRQLASAAKAIGNHELTEKLEKGSELLKRDIVFCSSLYL